MYSLVTHRPGAPRPGTARAPVASRASLRSSLRHHASQGLAAELAGATAGILAKVSAAKPASPDEFEPGEQKGKLLAAEDVTVESNLGCFPALDNGDEAGNASCVFDQALREGQLEGGIVAFVVFGDGEGARYQGHLRARTEAPAPLTVGNA